MMCLGKSNLVGAASASLPWRRPSLLLLLLRPAPRLITRLHASKYEDAMSAWDLAFDSYCADPVRAVAIAEAHAAGLSALGPGCVYVRSSLASRFASFERKRSKKGGHQGKHVVVDPKKHPPLEPGADLHTVEW
jgi:hypothetical protein